MRIWRSSDRDLVKVPDGVHGLGEPTICCALGPEERLGVRLWEHAGRADEVPCGQRKARIAVILLRSDVLHGPSTGRAKKKKRGTAGTGRT